MNNPSLCVIDEEEQDFNDLQQQSKEKKKLTRIDSDLLIDRYHSTQKFNRDVLQDISDNEDIQPQSPFSPSNNWQDDDEEDEDL